MWKQENNIHGEPSIVFMRRVEEDGHTFQEGSETITILTADHQYDKDIVEGKSL